MDEIVAGGLAGLVQTIVGYPLDTVKVCLVNKQPIRWRHIYRGAWSPALGAVAINAQTFYTYNYFRSLDIGPFGSGFLCGLGISVIESPTELVKIRMQTARKLEQVGYGQVMKSIVQSGHLFRGFFATCGRNSIGVGFYFQIYDHVMSTRSTDRNRYAASLLGGSLAGMVCWAGAYPFDYIKTRIQAEPVKKLKLQSLLLSTPPRAIFTGFVPCVVRAGVVNPFVFLTYEFTKSVWTYT